LSWKQRREITKELVGLNDMFIKRLGALSTLDDSCGLLPGANRNLAESLTSETFSTGSIRRLAENAERLQRLYEEVRSSPQNDGYKEVNDGD
jgi:hypothetical protein